MNHQLHLFCKPWCELALIGRAWYTGGDQIHFHPVFQTTTLKLVRMNSNSQVFLRGRYPKELLEQKTARCFRLCEVEN